MRRLQRPFMSEWYKERKSDQMIAYGRFELTAQRARIDLIAITLKWRFVTPRKNRRAQ